MPTKQIQIPIQLGEPVEHRGVAVAPLFPREQPRAEYLLPALAEAPRSRGPSAGLGEDLRLRGNGIVGSGLELEGELVQLCAFSSEISGSRTRISRPSRRV